VVKRVEIPQEAFLAVLKVNEWIRARIVSIVFVQAYEHHSDIPSLVTRHTQRG
jgi:hypothetical protein